MDYCSDLVLVFYVFCVFYWPFLLYLLLAISFMSSIGHFFYVFY